MVSLVVRSRICRPCYPQSVLYLPRNLCPTLLSRRPRPFDSDDYIFEIKFDGFRSRAFIVKVARVTLCLGTATRCGNGRISASIARTLPDVQNAILDGE